MAESSGLELQWHELCEKSMGTFFVNKVKLKNDVESSEPLYWEPPHLKNSSTKFLLFEEVVPKDGLERAIIVNSCKISDILDQCFYFLPQAELKVVCFPEVPEGDPHLERTIKVCPHHKATQFTYSEGVVSGTICGCSDFVRLSIVHPVKSRRLRTKLFLLRYKDSLRIVVPSGNLGSLFWDKLGLFGWFIDIPCNRNSEDAGDAEPAPKTDFECELREVLGNLNLLNAEKWLEGADFRVISPAVHLVGGVPRWRKSKLQGGNFVEQLVHPVREHCKTWKQMKIIQSHAVNTEFDEVKKLLQLDLRERNSFKVIYPSEECIKNAMKHTPDLIMKEVNDNTNLKYHDSGMYLKPFLFKAEDDRVLPYANVFMETFSSPDESNQHRLLGWMLFGSQTVGNVSWGMAEKFERYELGVAIVPYLQDEVIHAVDLGKIGFHFSLEPRAYERTDSPKSSDRNVCRCQGKIAQPRNAYQLSLPVTNVPQAERYGLNCLPAVAEKQRAQVSIHRDVWWSSLNDTTLARPGTYVDFLCHTYFGKKNKRWTLRISYLISAHETLSSLLRSLGKEDEAIEAEKAEQETDSARENWYEPTKAEKSEPEPKESFHRQKFKLQYGEGTEEDFEKYWKEQFEETYAFPTIIPNGDYENYKPEKEFDVTPWTSKMNDDTWLERQVYKTYGNVSNFIGPFSVPHLKGNFRMLGHKMFPGLENIEKAVSNKGQKKDQKLPVQT